jgi:hypothetical protein
MTGVVVRGKDLIRMREILFEYVAHAGNADTHRIWRSGFALLSTA